MKSDTEYIAIYARNQWARYFGLPIASIPNVACCNIIASRVLEKELSREQMRSALIKAGMNEKTANCIADNS